MSTDFDCCHRLLLPLLRRLLGSAPLLYLGFLVAPSSEREAEFFSMALWRWLPELIFHYGIVIHNQHMLIHLEFNSVCRLLVVLVVVMKKTFMTTIGECVRRECLCLFVTLCVNE